MLKGQSNIHPNKNGGRWATALSHIPPSENAHTIRCVAHSDLTLQLLIQNPLFTKLFTCGSLIFLCLSGHCIIPNDINFSNWNRLISQFIYHRCFQNCLSSWISQGPGNIPLRFWPRQTWWHDIISANVSAAHSCFPCFQSPHYTSAQRCSIGFILICWPGRPLKYTELFVTYDSLRCFVTWCLIMPKVTIIRCVNG